MRREDIVVAGGITEVVGRPSSGRTGLVIACVREVTRNGGLVGFVDTDAVLDPIGAARAGVELSRMLWIRCGRRHDRSLRAVDLLVRCPGFALVVLDAGELTPRLALAAAYRVKLAVRRTGTALLVVGRHRIFGGGATVAVEVARRAVRWSGPGSAPTRLDAMEAAVEVVRASGGASALRVGMVGVVRLSA
jgi:hypothetical protein